MKFRKVAALSLASVMALSLAACGGNSGGDSKGSDDSSTKTEGEGEKAESGSSSDAELSVSIWDTNQEPGIKEILADFTEKTGIKTKTFCSKMGRVLDHAGGRCTGRFPSGCILDAFQ